MKSGRGADPKEVGNFRAGIGLKIITVPELVVRGEEPARVRFNALERSDVVLQIDVPARSVSVFLTLRVRRQRIQIRFLPKTFRQGGESKAGIELLRRLDNPIRAAALEVFVDVSGFNQIGPFLRPPIVDPVRRDFY